MAKNTWPESGLAYARALAQSKLSWLPPLVIIAIVGSSILLPPPSSQSLIDKGDGAWVKQDLATSFYFYHQALLQDPQNAQLHLKLSRVYEAANNYDQALVENNQAQALNPALNLQSEINRLVAISNKPQQLHQQVAELANLTSSYPDFRDAWVRLAYLHYQLKEDGAARTALDKALAIDPIYEPAISLQTLLP